MKDIKVFGHRSPDTDAASSAVVWAWFLNEYRNQQAQAYVLGNMNTEAEFVFKSWGVDIPPLLEKVEEGDDVAIVDTNNLDELFPNINDTNIISVIDHHKLSGNLKTNTPLEVVLQPYASTMTVMFNIMNIDVHNLPRHIAGLMLSGILSDTLEFRSPTTTDDDRALAKELALALEINITEYAHEMFDAKSNIAHFSPEELLRMDSKIFDIKGENMRVSVLETTNPSLVLERYDELITAIPDIAREDDVVEVLLFIIDILEEESIMILHNDRLKTLAKEAFGQEGDGKTIVLPGIVSRKKQILPALLK